MKVLAFTLFVLCLSLPYCSTAYTGYAVALGFPVRASSIYDRSHFNYLLDSVQPTDASSWCAGALDTNQWIEVSSTEPITWTGVITQGRHIAYSQWVTSFTVVYSNDGKTWSNVDNGKTFTGNTDTDTKVTNMFATPVVARTLRIKPQTWHNFISMRFDALFSSS